MSIQALQGAKARIEQLKAGVEQGPKAASGAGGDDFSARLEQALESVDDTVQNADVVTELQARGDASMSQMMVALEEANISMRAMVSVRDKVVSAYEQVMNMAI
ncbi:MAG: flagellar hook-basal body complex protein FliE [Proteobacteria bacterium]|nr:flagellar hook-basal body complex protein FliE [Pseudomonadota bacterium]MCP4921706.1 flagellar hook-basal body complex protein FliE [Pseudomonadota bacterium]